MGGTLGRQLRVMNGIQELFLRAGEPHVFASGACELLAGLGPFPSVSLSMRTSSGSRYETGWARGCTPVRESTFAIHTDASNGVLTIGFDEETPPDEDTRTLFRTIASTVARSIEMLERRRADHAGARRLRRLRERLDAISQALERSGTDASRIYEEVLRDVVEDLGMDIAYVGSVENGRAVLKHVYPRDIRGESDTAFVIDGTLTGWMLDSGESAVGLTGLLADARFSHLHHLRQQGTTTFAGAPFALDDRQWFLSLGGAKPRAPFDEDEIDYLRTLAAFFRMSCLQDELRRLQFFDEQTGMPNQTMFRRRVDEIIALDPSRTFFMLRLEIEHLHAFVRRKGEREGNELVKSLALSLQQAARENIVYRTGAETFTVLCPQISDDVSVDELGALLASAADEVLVEFGSGNANIGAAAYARDGHSVEELERALIDALDEARSDDMPELIFRSLARDSEVRHRRALRRELQQALRNGELMLYFQPYSDLRSNTFVGAEALLRWDSPTRGIVLPSEFIPLAEQTDLIAEIGTWVMNRALEIAAPWQRYGEFEISVNVSARQVGPQLVEMLSHVLSVSGFDPTRLVLEITESTAMDVNRDVVNVLNRCHELGVRIAIDDFGTGYSSLAYLKQLPVDIVKLDRTFVEGLPYDPYDAAIASAVIAMGTRFGSVILAEGVETDEQLHWLRAAGCTLAQGYRLAAPMPPEELAGLLAEAVA